MTKDQPERMLATELPAGTVIANFNTMGKRRLKRRQPSHC